MLWMLPPHFGVCGFHCKSNRERGRGVGSGARERCVALVECICPINPPFSVMCNVTPTKPDHSTTTRTLNQPLTLPPTTGGPPDIVVYQMYPHQLLIPLKNICFIQQQRVVVYGFIYVHETMERQEGRRPLID